MLLQIAIVGAKIAGLPIPSVVPLIGKIKDNSAGDVLKDLTDYYKGWKEPLEATRGTLREVQTDVSNANQSLIDECISMVNEPLPKAAYDEAYELLKRLLVNNGITDWQTNNGMVGGLQRVIVKRFSTAVNRSPVEWVCSNHANDTIQYYSSKSEPRADEDFNLTGKNTVSEDLNYRLSQLENKFGMKYQYSSIQLHKAFSQSSAEFGTNSQSSLRNNSFLRNSSQGLGNSV